MIGDAGQDVGKPCPRVDAVQFTGLNQRVDGGCALTSAIGAAEGPVASANRNLAVILPMSGRMSWFNIAGIRCTGETHASFRASGARQASLCTWS